MGSLPSVTIRRSSTQFNVAGVEHDSCAETLLPRAEAGRRPKSDERRNGKAARLWVSVLFLHSACQPKDIPIKQPLQQRKDVTPFGQKANYDYLDQVGGNAIHDGAAFFSGQTNELADDEWVGIYSIKKGQTEARKEARKEGKLNGKRYVRIERKHQFIKRFIDQ